MSVCRVVPHLLASLAAVLLTTAPVGAQRQLAAIRGVVLDDSSRAVPGVTIDLADPLGSIVDSTTSDPNAVAEGRARGLEVRVEVQRWRSWSAYANAAIARVRQRGPVTGGLFLEEEVAEIISGGEFIPDHDQFLVASGGWTWTPSRFGATLSFTIRHETGTPVGTEDDDVEDLQVRPGAETVDFDRGRVAARTVASVLAELPIWRQGRRSVFLRTAVLNLFDARYAYNFGNPFSGTHFGAPRTVLLAVRLGL